MRRFNKKMAELTKQGLFTAKEEARIFNAIMMDDIITIQLALRFKMIRECNTEIEDLYSLLPGH